VRASIVVATLTNYILTDDLKRHAPIYIQCGHHLLPNDPCHCSVENVPKLPLLELPFSYAFDDQYYACMYAQIYNMMIRVYTHIS
jgi:hypothetical protein